MPENEVLFDPSDAGLRTHPYPVYERMREEAPAWRSPEGVWYFSRFEDCCAIYRTQPSYDMTKSAAFQQRLSDDPAERVHQLEENQKGRMMIDCDPPEHTRLRSLVNRAFTPTSVEASKPKIAEIIDQLLDGFAGPTVDVVADYALLVPILVICDMLGVDPSEHHRFVEIGHEVVRTVDPDVGMDERIAAVQLLRDYCSFLVELKRGQPTDDLMTRLIEATEDGRVASEDELVANTGLLLVAGFETTTSLIANAIYELLSHPDELAKLREDPELIRSAIEEVLRLDPPVHLTRPRVIVEETEIGGATLHPSDPVVPLVAAANRDPEEFEDPGSFDIERSDNRHLSFGLGRHHCLGAALARLEAQLAVLKIFERFPEMSLSSEHEPVMRPNLVARGFSELVVRI